MNCDSHLCQYDLFSIIRHVNNQLFIDSINKDIKDIRKKMNFKEKVDKAI